MTFKLPREFYRQPTLTVAQLLIGKIFVSKRAGAKLTGKIVEVEAYIGEDDPACHARFGKTGRNAVMYGDAGRLYVYFIYGMHNMLNFVTEGKGTPAAVLIRAVEPIDGIELMQKNRGVGGIHRLCSGPGKLCQAFDIKLTDTGKSLTGGEYFVLDDGGSAPKVASCSRIGITQGHDLLWRFYDSESKFVSPSRRIDARSD
ncbi:MAG: DNA-3-methyladenine glycosylase [Candidatus Zixiibacteriota bacterium]